MTPTPAAIKPLKVLAVCGAVAAIACFALNENTVALLIIMALVVIWGSLGFPLSEVPGWWPCTARRVKQLEVQLKQLLEAHNTTVAVHDENTKDVDAAFEWVGAALAVQDENTKTVDASFERVGAALEQFQNRVKWLEAGQGATWALPIMSVTRDEDAEQQLKRGRELAAQHKYQEAVWCFKRGLEVNPNHATLQCYLGNAYFWGEGVTQDRAQAIVWLRKAAEQGNAFAECKLGDACHAGECVPQDHVQAVIWWRKAAEQGLAEAEFQLGVAYDGGQGVPQDQAEAAIWFRKAAEQGHVIAGVCLARAYYTGEGIPQDYTQAANWWRKAVGQGDEKDALQ